MCLVGRRLGASTSEPSATVRTKPVADHREEEGNLNSAPRVVQVVLAEHEEGVHPCVSSSLLTLDTRERLEGRTSRRATS